MMNSPQTASTAVRQITAAAQPAPTGQAVVTGNGINYNGGPVMKATRADLHHLVRQLERHRLKYCRHRS